MTVSSVLSGSTPSASSRSTPSMSPDRGLRQWRICNDEADLTLAYFKQHTLEYLTGLLGRDWRALLLRAVEQNDALYHAALAVASIHKTVVSRQKLSIRLDDDEYAIRQYTKALRCLSPDPSDSATVDFGVVLVACLLFIGFESLRGNHGTVLQHVQSGTSIIRHHLGDPQSMAVDRSIPLPRLIPAFARLERQLQELTGAESPLIQALAEEQTAAGFFHYGGPEPQPVPFFADLDEAWVGLHQRWHSLIKWVGLVHIDWFNHMGDVHKASNVYATPWEDSEVLARRYRELSRDFDLWSLGLEHLKSRLQDMSPKQKAIHALLKCHILLANNVLSTASLPRENLWDEYRDQFAEIVALCYEVVEHERVDLNMKVQGAGIFVQHRYAPDQLRIPETRLTFEMGLCMIMLHVLGKCRDAQIRLDAVKLMEDHPRLEGLWDGGLIAKAGRAIDKLERGDESLEDAAARHAPAGDIPLSKRILDLRAVFHQNSRSGCLMLYTDKRMWEAGTITTQVDFEW